VPASIAAVLALAATLGLRAEATSPAQRIGADVERLASAELQGRRAGTEGGDRAAAWIAGRFQALGLAPGGDRGSYLQEFTFIDGVSLGPGNRLATSVAGAPRSWKVGEDFRPLAFSSAGSVSAGVVFAGYGIVAPDLGYDDYEGIQVTDRVVLVLRYGPGGNDTQSRWAAFTPLRMKAAAARDRGAKALLIVTGPGTPEVKDELVPLRADASLSDSGLPVFSVRRPVAEALFAGSRTTLETAQQSLDHAARPAPQVLASSVEATADVSPRRATTQNVVGILDPPSGAAAEAVVVGAHYDHLGLGATGSLDPAPEGKIHHGADDNASGVAGVLELARRLSARRATLERSVVFVGFGAEELGTLGSSYFVKNPPVPLERVVAMANMDMIGRLRDGTLDVHGVGTSPVWGPLIEESNRDSRLQLKLHEGGYGPSDHSPFYAAGKPVLFVFTGVHRDYHRPTDTAEKVDAPGIDRVLSLVEPVVWSLASGRTDTVPFVRVAADKEQPSTSGARGFRVWLGGIPDYSAEVAGVRLSGVSPGSPAEKAGLKGGDVLVKLGSKEIRNIYDYTYALGAHKPGDRVIAVVRRAGEAVEAELVLAARPSAAR